MLIMKKRTPAIYGVRTKLTIENNFFCNVSVHTQTTGIVSLLCLGPMHNDRAGPESGGHDSWQEASEEH